jgi:hypothetical protein
MGKLVFTEAVVLLSFIKNLALVVFMLTVGIVKKVSELRLLSTTSSYQIDLSQLMLVAVGK